MCSIPSEQDIIIIMYVYIYMCSSNVPYIIIIYPAEIHYNTVMNVYGYFFYNDSYSCASSRVIFITVKEQVCSSSSILHLSVYIS